MFGIVFCAVYIITFVISFGLSKYASSGLIAAVNGALSFIGTVVVLVGMPILLINGDLTLLFFVLYICIPNIIMYLILRRGRKEKYNFKVHLLKALIMTCIWFPFLYLAVVGSVVVYVY